MTELGTRVRFTVDGLGVTARPHSTKFLRQKVNAGDTGSYLYPADWINESDWHLIAVHSTSPMGVEYVPCHRSMFEEAESA